MIHSNSTGGTSQRSGTSPVFSYSDFKRLLSGRVKAGIADAEEDLYNFTFEATLLLSDYASQFPNIARALRIPRNYCCQTIAQPKARISLTRIRPTMEYRILALST